MDKQPVPGKSSSSGPGLIIIKNWPKQIVLIEETTGFTRQRKSRKWMR